MSYLYWKKFRGFNYLLLLIMFCSMALACSSDKAEEGRTLSKVIVGLSPGESVENLKKRFLPLMSYLSKDTGLKFELYIPETYAGLMDAFDQEKVDMALFGGVLFVKAHHQYQAVPLAMRDIDLHFFSYYLANSKFKSNKLTDYKDKRFSFGAKLSTSGHIMPRFYMQDSGIFPDTFFSEIKYSGKHDQTAYWIRDGEVDLGVASSPIIDKMYANGSLLKKDVRIIGQTPEFPDYVWAIQPSISNSQQIKIRDAFLNLTLEDEEHRKILKLLNADHFLPVQIEEFAKMRKVLEELGMLN